MVKVRDQNSNRKTFKQMAENGQKISIDASVAGTVDPICFTQNFEQLLTKNLW